MYWIDVFHLELYFVLVVFCSFFIDGLRPHSKQFIDVSIGGKIKLKTLDEAMELIENMITNDHAILRDRAYTPTKKSLLELISQDTLLAQNKLLAKQIETLTESLSKLPQQLHVVQPAHSSTIQNATFMVRPMS